MSQISFIVTFALCMGFNVALGQVQLTAANGRAGDQFGSAVDISDDTMVIGAWAKTIGLTDYQGCAYVFTRTGSTWTQQAQLTASDGDRSDLFGCSVAISGDTIIVGAYADDFGINGDQGSAYVFVRTGTTWTEQAKLSVSGCTYFGRGVSISGDSVAIGANTPGLPGGSVYVFTRAGTAWSQEALLYAEDGMYDDGLGRSVSISGDTVIAGASGDDEIGSPGMGSAYIFVRENSSWSQQIKLTPTITGGNVSYFGSAVAISGDSVIIGANHPNNLEGWAYFYRRSGSLWTQEGHVTGGEYFGSAVDISEDRAIVGAYLNQPWNGVTTDQGTAYVFRRSGTTWSRQVEINAPFAASFDYFGSSVAISGSDAAVAAYRDDIGANADQGSCWAFRDCSPILAEPTSTAVLPSRSASFSLTGLVGTTQYQWRKDGILLQESTRIQGVQSQTMTILNVQNVDQGIYECLVAGDCGTVTSRSVNLSCAPIIERQPPSFLRLNSGIQIALQVPTGASYTYRWRQNGQNLFNISGLFSGVTSRTLTIQGIDASLAGTYDCVLTNSCGTTISSATFVPCLADFTLDGGVDGDDVILYFSLWDANDVRADVTEDGGVDGDDVIAYFARWDAGC